jgi:cobalt-zinc-cadmium efflux system protein
MGAGNHGHAHGHGHGRGQSNRRAIGVAALLTGVFMAVEAAGGLAANSLALIADAGHMATDFAALALGWLAFRMAERPADAARTYGFDRWSVLVAFVNGLALFAVAAWIVVEAVHRIGAPEPVAGRLMLWIAVAGLAVNVVVFAVLSRGDRENLNLRAALLHVAGDLLGSVAAIAAALVILGTGWTPIDPILSTLVALLILVAAWRVVRESGHILLEGAPASFDAGCVRAALRDAVPGLADVRHLHAWSISQERPMITLEAVLDDGADGEAARGAIRRVLAERFGFDHATIEICATDAGADRQELPVRDRASI